jgi:hypothetical protein
VLQSVGGQSRGRLITVSSETTGFPFRRLLGLAGITVQEIRINRRIFVNIHSELIALGRDSVHTAELVAECSRNCRRSDQSRRVPVQVFPSRERGEHLVQLVFTMQFYADSMNGVFPHPPFSPRRGLQEQKGGEDL